MSDYHSRVEQAIEARKTNPSAVSLAAGMNRDTLGKSLKKRDQPTIETVRKIANSLSTRPEYLAFGVGTLDGHKADKLHEAFELGLPVAGRVEAGIWVAAEARHDPDERIPITPDVRYPPHTQFVLEVRGTSMNRVFVQGDLLHCVSIMEAGIRPRENDVVIIERTRPNGEVETSAKRHKRIAGEFAAVPDSTDEVWRDVVFWLENNPAADGEEVTVTAVVLRVIRELRP